MVGDEFCGWYYFSSYCGSMFCTVYVPVWMFLGFFRFWIAGRRGRGGEFRMVRNGME